MAGDKNLPGNNASSVGGEYLALEAIYQVRLRHWQELWQAADVSENAARKRTLRFAEKVDGLLASQPVENPVQEAIAKATATRVKGLRSSLA